MNLKTSAAFGGAEVLRCFFPEATLKNVWLDVIHCSPIYHLHGMAWVGKEGKNEPWEGRTQARGGDLGLDEESGKKGGSHVGLQHGQQA